MGPVCASHRCHYSISPIRQHGARPRGCVVKTFKKKTNEEEKATVQVWHPGQWICWSVIVGLLSGCRLFRMLLVLSEDHKEHLAFLPKVEPAGK